MSCTARFADLAGAFCLIGDDLDLGAGRPFIAALVLSKARGGLPAIGFFDCARRLGRFAGDPDGVEARSFHATELNAALKFWGGCGASGNNVYAAALPGDARAMNERSCDGSAKMARLAQVVSSLFLKEFVSAFFLSMRCFFAPKKT